MEKVKKFLDRNLLKDDSIRELDLKDQLIWLKDNSENVGIRLNAAKFLKQFFHEDK